MLLLRADGWVSSRELKRVECHSWHGNQALRNRVSEAVPVPVPSTRRPLQVQFERWESRLHDNLKLGDCVEPAAMAEHEPLIMPEKGAATAPQLRPSGPTRAWDGHLLACFGRGDLSGWSIFSLVHLCPCVAFG